jgi:hypothetical protein
MFKNVGISLSVVWLSAVLLFTCSAWAQISPRNQVFALASTVSTNSENSSVHKPQPVAKEDLASSESRGSIEIEIAPDVTATSATKKTIPPTLTVSTAALLELHAMRQNAVDLCLQLPSKYRTRLPECAEIFEHEIRLKQLAKKRQ